MRHAILLAALCGCTSQGALVVVTVDAQPALSAAQLSGTATLGTRSKNFTITVPGGTIPPKLIFGIELGPDDSGTLNVMVNAGSESAHGSVPIVPHGRADLPITFGETNADMGDDAGENADQSMVPFDLFDSDSLTFVSRRYVVNHVTLPQSRNDFANDLNGDGRLDNQYGNIEGALDANGFAVTTDAGTTVSLGELALNQEIAAGTYLLLIEHQSADPLFVTDPYSRAVIRRAQAHANPVFDGTGAFAVDPAFGLPRLDGILSATQFSSHPVFTLSQPIDVQVRLAFAGVVVPVTLIGTHIEYQITSDGLMIGRMQGAMSKTLLDATIIPAIAQGLNNQVAADPGGTHAMQILQIFDIGDTVGQCDGIGPRDLVGFPDGSSCFCALKNDGYIDNCEIAQNSIIKNVLNPDVDLFDDNGNWAPSAANAGKDSVSMAFAFTAVPASF